MRLLEFMVGRGEVAVTGRDAKGRLWDLAERVYPDVDPVPVGDALRIRDERRLRALGIARSRGAESGIEPVDVGAAGEPAVVEGVKGEWRVDPTYLRPPFTGRAVLLSPLDRLVFDRKRTAELFEFDYYLELYKPPRSAAGAIGRYRSSTATGWSESSTQPPTASAACFASARSTRTSRSPRR